MQRAFKSTCKNRRHNRSMDLGRGHRANSILSNRIWKNGCAQGCGTPACCCVNYGGGYTILKDWLQPQRSAARTVAVRRFETPAGTQAQVDWGHLGTLESEGERKLWGFTFTLGY